MDKPLKISYVFLTKILLIVITLICLAFLADSLTDNRISLRILSKLNNSEIINNNYLEIDKLGINGLIREGQESELLRGLWRVNTSSTPEDGGNTVISAHRFMITTGGNTFYNLENIGISDEIKLKWHNKIYIYKVFGIFKVDPQVTEVLENTKESILTLITCTPLWSNEQRLVVRANLISVI